jgi:solute carrier family 9 (sodium/hydrogen exchanger), member 3
VSLDFTGYSGKNRFVQCDIEDDETEESFMLIVTCSSSLFSFSFASYFFLSLSLIFHTCTCVTFICLVFHLSHRLTKKFPENCLLIILGIIVGILLYITHLEDEKRIYILNSDTFFLFLLPPIVLETGYFLPKRAFFDNIGTILLLAVLNKLFNTMCIGVTVWAFGKTILYGGTSFSLLECLLLASFITAVDPIAVLATFVEIRVNDTLYIVVFGESLLNDAVSIVSYQKNTN